MHTNPKSAKMEKAPMYTVLHSPTDKRVSWASWASVGVSFVAIICAGVAIAMAVTQMDRTEEIEGKLVEMEGRMMEMEGHMEEMLEFTLSGADYFDYDEEGVEEDRLEDDHHHLHDDSQPGPYEHLTVRRVGRKRRQTNSVEDNPAVPIYDQAYGVDLKSNSEGLRLYESLQVTNGQGDPMSPEVTVEATESPIKPYHRISNLWVPKKRGRLPASALTTRDLGGEERNGIMNRRRAVTQRRSRTKSLHGSGRQVRSRQKHRALSNTNPVSVQFRDTRVKATSRHDGFDSGSNSVVPQAPPLPESPGTNRVVVQQSPLAYSRGPETGYSKPANLLVKDGQRKRRPRKKNGRRRRRARPVLSLAHFIADNSTTNGYSSSTPHSWIPAVWMTNLGLNRKYSMDQDTVVVKEAGLYYLYAQVLYEAGRQGSGFQILVDDIPVMECSLGPTNPAPSCHTSGTSYIPRHAAVSVRDMDSGTTPVRTHANTFFGLVKLMDAPDSAEQLVLS